MKEHEKNFDQAFKEIQHYKQFPAMIPYVGINYGANGNPKILLIGESFYLPNKTKINKKAELWYNSSQKELTQDEINWMHCRGLLECDWDSDGHMIYRELNKNLEKHFDSNDHLRAITNIAFTNGFLRPSPKEGDSIRNHLEQLDIEKGIEITRQVINIIEPDYVIFVSKFTWDCLHAKIKVDKAIKLDFTCHPGTGGRYWHNKEYKHGKRKFNRILKTALSK